MTLRSHLELRLGEPLDVGLELAIAAEVIPCLADGTTYLDVRFPTGRSPLTLNSKVEVECQTSTNPRGPPLTMPTRNC